MDLVKNKLPVSCKISFLMCVGIMTGGAFGIKDNRILGS